MIELHTHSLLSDGALLPSESLRRAQASGFEALAITDHVDNGNVDRVVSELTRMREELIGHFSVQLIVGAEITHVPPSLIDRVARRARAGGAQLILVHGETLAEPVAAGTNRAALEADCDLLAHPGIILEEEVELAVRRGIYLEISGRKGHSLGNGHLVTLARAAGARLVINSDAHYPGEVMDLEMRRLVGRGSGLSEEETEAALENMRQIAERCRQGISVCYRTMP